MIKAKSMLRRIIGFSWEADMTSAVRTQTPWSIWELRREVDITYGLWMVRGSQ